METLLGLLSCTAAAAIFVLEVSDTIHRSSWRLVNNWMEIAWDVKIHRKCQIFSIMQWVADHVWGIDLCRKYQSFFFHETADNSLAYLWRLVSNWMEIAWVVEIVV